MAPFRRHTSLRDDPWWMYRSGVPMISAWASAGEGNPLVAGAPPAVTVTRAAHYLGTFFRPAAICMLISFPHGKKSPGPINFCRKFYKILMDGEFIFSDCGRCVFPMSPWLYLGLT